MPVSGVVNVEFMKYTLYGEVMVLSVRFEIYKMYESSGTEVKIKDLPATCNPINVSGGVGISCKASDTSTDTYTTSSFRLKRSVTGLPSGAPDDVLYHAARITKASDQRLDIELRAQLTA